MEQFGVAQNFLQESSLIERLVSKVDFPVGATVLDIGAGDGQISEVLSNLGYQVLAVEPDVELARQLKERMVGSHVQVVNEPFDRFMLPDYNFYTFSNLPFNKTSEIIKKLLVPRSLLVKGSMIVQKEAAQRFGGEQLSGRNTLLSVLFGVRYSMEITHHFNKHDFSPAPSVDPVLFTVIRRDQPLIDPELIELFADFVSYIFNRSQPTLDKADGLITLTQLERFEHNLGLKRGATPSQIDTDQYLSIFKFFYSSVREKLKLVEGEYGRLMEVEQEIHKIHRTRAVKGWHKQQKSTT